MFIEFVRTRLPHCRRTRRCRCVQVKRARSKPDNILIASHCVVYLGRGVPELFHTSRRERLVGVGIVVVDARRVTHPVRPDSLRVSVAPAPSRFIHTRTHLGCGEIKTARRLRAC